MAKPTHPTLATVYGKNLVPMVDGTHELWSVTNHMLVPKGSNMEQILSDMMTGKYQADPTKFEKIEVAVTDVTKLG